MKQNNDCIKENGAQQSYTTDTLDVQKSPAIPPYSPLPSPTSPGNVVKKVEDCNSSRESIDVESTQPEDIKPSSSTTVSNANNNTKLLNPADTSHSSSSLQSTDRTIELNEVNWSLYHLGDMTLEVWLQAIRKHILMPLMRHPK